MPPATSCTFTVCTRQLPRDDPFTVHSSNTTAGQVVCASHQRPHPHRVTPNLVSFRCLDAIAKGSFGANAQCHWQFTIESMDINPSKRSFTFALISKCKTCTNSHIRECSTSNAYSTTHDVTFQRACRDQQDAATWLLEAKCKTSRWASILTPASLLPYGVTKLGNYN